MGWPPAVIIVVRHGARLDAADKQWHLTSPTPYDPPLTYGGWTQSRALGARIANILRTRETDDEIPVVDGLENRKSTRKRRHKVIIHTSPFLRCVQTSVAISAGLAQNPGHLHQTPSGSPAVKATKITSSPRIRPLVAIGSPQLAPIQEPGDVSKTNGRAAPQDQPNNIKKSTVRVDAFLGEWLTPDYFEQITPPPSSIMMVAGAKADLLRREDYSNLLHTQDVKAVQGFPGGWGSPIVAPNKEKEESLLSHSLSLGANLPRRDRTSSLSSVGSAKSSHSQKSGLNIQLNTPTEHGIYMPPVPSYAISNSDPIPPGHFAHSRDACVDVDYQWDSMRDPQHWGSGGEYGEEWSQMHKRFRSGIQSLLQWYTTSNDPGRLLTKLPRSPTYPAMATEEDADAEDEDTDLVIILVTHGAGCNALIGALTNQPVLLDVGMASLTMAVRKPTMPVNSPLSSPPPSPRHSRRSSRNTTIADQYDVKLIANTEHLRTTNSSTPSRQSSSAGVSAFRERFVSPASLDSSGFPKSKIGTMPSSFGSIRRTASIASGVPRSYIPTRQSSIGLWSAPAKEEDDEVNEEPEDDMILNFGDEGANGPKFEEEKETPALTLLSEKLVSHSIEAKEDDIAPLGLWGSPRPPGYAEKIREIAPKRRWTVNERG